MTTPGPDAVELLLQALGFCYAVECVANAAAVRDCLANPIPVTTTLEVVN